MDWKHLRACITGSVDQHLLLRNESLVTENRLLRNQITSRMRLTDGERKTLVEIGQQLLEALVVRMARENRSWGYDRVVGALANLDYTISDQTIGNILKRHGLPPAPERKTTTTWKEFIRTHMDVLVATDFCTAEVWTRAALVTYYVLFFIHLQERFEALLAGRKAGTLSPEEAREYEAICDLDTSRFEFFGLTGTSTQVRGRQSSPTVMQAVLPLPRPG
jgi:hypothetical protein